MDEQGPEVALETLSEEQVEQLREAIGRWNQAIRTAEYARINSLGDRLRLCRCQDTLEGAMRELDRVVELRWIHPVVIGQPLRSAMQGLSDVLTGIIDNTVDSTVTTLIRPVTLRYTRGRPSIEIDPAFLRDYLDNHHQGPEGIAAVLNKKPTYDTTGLPPHIEVSASTVRRQILKHKIRLPRQPSRLYDDDMSDGHLRALIKNELATQKKVGQAYIQGTLVSDGIRVQRDRMRKALQHVRPFTGTLLEVDGSLRPRQVYTSPGANHFWHLDGQHELVNFGIVVHGITDGYSRLIVGLRASSNNKAATMADLFLEATCRCGWPSHVRGDCGGENVIVAALQTLYRGASRGSFTWGTSPHNTRIERLWPELKRLCLDAWLAFFLVLEKTEGLDNTLDHHKWLLCYLFLPTINQQLDKFRRQHNSHPTSSMGNKTPNFVFSSSQITSGQRGLEADRPRPTLAELDQIDTSEFDDQVTNHTPLFDARSPFLDPVAGRQQMDFLTRNADRRPGFERDLFRTGADAMFSLIEADAATFRL